MPVVSTKSRSFPPQMRCERPDTSPCGLCARCLRKPLHCQLLKLALLCSSGMPETFTYQIRQKAVSTPPEEAVNGVTVPPQEIRDSKARLK